jgi:Peptidase family M23
MRWHWVKAGVLSAVLVAAGTVAPASATGTAPAGGHAAAPNLNEAFTLVVSTVLAPPNVVLGADDRQHLAYELQLLNVAPFPVTVARVDTLDADTGAVLATVRDAALVALIKRPEGGEFTGALGGGLTGLAVLDLSLPRSASLPRNLVHRLTISFDPNSVPPGFPSPVPYLTGRTRVSHHQPVTVAPPLRGPGWVAVNGCCNAANSHRGGIIPIDGNLRAVERFAIDFVQLGPDRRLFVGPLENLSSYRYFGSDVRSVADGTVVRTHDGEPEQTPPNGPADFPTPQNAGGNWLVVDIGGGHFAFYAHLQPHSITTKVGDRVHRGQVLGRLGNTGSTTAPHLHFHIMDGPSLDSNGLPFQIDTFTSPGTVTDENILFQGAPTPISPALAGPHRRQLPLDLQVVDFD